MLTIPTPPLGAWGSIRPEVPAESTRCSYSPVFSDIDSDAVPGCDTSGIREHDQTVVNPNAFATVPVSDIPVQEVGTRAVGGARSLASFDIETTWAPRVGKASTGPAYRPLAPCPWRQGP